MIVHFSGRSMRSVQCSLSISTVPMGRPSACALTRVCESVVKAADFREARNILLHGGDEAEGHGRGKKQGQVSNVIARSRTSHVLIDRSENSARTG
jgi:hypothetical protein